MQPQFDPALVQRSMESARNLADVVLPLLVEAFDFSVEQVKRVPPGGLQDDRANLQALPNLVRLNLIKLIRGYNEGAPKPTIVRKGSPNNGLWLGIVNDDQMARLYKDSSRYKIRPSGVSQERLINQARYRELQDQGLLFPEYLVTLDALIQWRSNGFALESAFVLLPNGWDENRNLVVIDKQPLDLPNPLEEIAAFHGGAEVVSVIEGTPIVTAGRVNEEWEPEEREIDDDVEAEASFQSDEATLGESSISEENEFED